MLKNLTQQAQEILTEQFRNLPEDITREGMQSAMLGLLVVAMEIAAKDAIKFTTLVKRIIPTPDTKGYNQAQYEQEVKIKTYLNYES